MIRPARSGAPTALRRWSVGALLALPGLLSGCGDEDPAPHTTPERAAPATADGWREALLARHHGAIRNTLDRSVLEFRKSDAADDVEPTKVTMALPTRVRIDHPAQRVELWTPGAVQRCTPGAAPQPLEAAARTPVDLAVAIAGMLALTPLQHGQATAAEAEGQLTVTTPDGTPWQVGFDPATRQVQRIAAGVLEVTFLAWLDTGVTVMPQQVRLPASALGPAGDYDVKFVAYDMNYADAMFEDPFGTTTVAPAISTPREQIEGNTEKPRTPELQQMAARSLLVLDLPDTWPARRDALIQAGETLGAGGQRPAGLPLYGTVADQPKLLVPFMPADPDGPAFGAEGHELLAQPQRSVLVIAPPPGPWQEVVDRGRSELEAFALQHGLQLQGALLVSAFLNPVEVPSPEQLARVELRLEWDVQE